MNQNKNTVYQQLADNIRSKIVAGEYKVGEKIMSERKMAMLYGINRLTVRKAIQLLINEGTLEANHGSGTFVRTLQPSEHKVQLGTDENISLSSVLRQSGFNNSRKVLSFKKVKVDGTIQNYFKNVSEAYQLIRLSYIDNTPYALQICYFPCNLFRRPDRFDFGDGSLYTYMELQGHRPRTIVNDMWLTVIPDEFKEVMKLDSGELVFYYEYFGYDSNKIMVEFTQSYYNPEYTSFKYISDIVK